MTIQELHDLTGVLISQNFGDEPVRVGFKHSRGFALDLKMYFDGKRIDGAILVAENAYDLEPNCTDIIA